MGRAVRHRDDRSDGGGHAGRGHVPRRPHGRHPAGPRRAAGAPPDPAALAAAAEKVLSGQPARRAAMGAAARPAWRAGFSSGPTGRAPAGLLRRLARHGADPRARRDGGDGRGPGGARRRHDERGAGARLLLRAGRGGERRRGVAGDVPGGAAVHLDLRSRQPCRRHSGGRMVRTSFLQHVTREKRLAKALLPLYPAAFAGFDLAGYDVVISSASSFAKCVRAPRGACHICYCYSPTHFLWPDHHYLGSYGRATQLLTRLARPGLRRLDYRAARRVDHFIAISRVVAARIERCYGRPATVIPPPIRLAEFPLRAAAPGPDAPYLVLSRLVGYKRVDLAIAAANAAGRAAAGRGGRAGPGAAGGAGGADGAVRGARGAGGGAGPAGGGAGADLPRRGGLRADAAGGNGVRDAGDRLRGGRGAGDGGGGAYGGVLRGADGGEPGGGAGGLRPGGLCRGGAAGARGAV